MDIAGGRADGGAAFSVNGNSIINTNGGGIYIASGNPNLSDIKVASNSAFQNGGGIYSTGCPTLLNSKVMDNISNGDGGGIYLVGSCMDVFVYLPLKGMKTWL